MTTNLTTKREEILKEFDKTFSKIKDYSEGWDFKKFLDQALQSYGEEVAKQTREKVIEECINDFDNEFWKAEFERGSTTLHSNVLISLDQLRSTQPTDSQKQQLTILKKMQTTLKEETDKDKP